MGGGARRELGKQHRYFPAFAQDARRSQRPAAAQAQVGKHLMAEFSARRRLKSLKQERFLHGVGELAGSAHGPSVLHFQQDAAARTRSPALSYGLRHPPGEGVHLRLRQAQRQEQNQRDHVPILSQGQTGKNGQR